MGQIVGLNAKCKRANLNALGNVPTPANGEIILVSSNNSMTSDGSGNFDCYIVGDGTTSAPNLPLHKELPYDGEMLTQSDMERTGTGYIMYSSGNLNSSANMEYFAIPNVGYTRIWCCLSSADAVSAAIAFYSNDTISGSTYLSDYSVQLTSGNNKIYEAEVPQEAKLIVITNRKAARSASFCLYKPSKAYVLESQLTDAVERNVQNAVTSQGVYSEIYRNQSYTPFAQVNNAGAIKASLTTFISTPIPVTAGQSLMWVYSDDQATLVYLRFEDSNHSMVGGAYTSSNGSAGSRTITVPSSAAYVIGTFVDKTGYTPAIYINGTLAWQKEQSSVDERLEKVEKNVGCVLTQDDFISGDGYISYSTGALSSSANMEYFAFPNKGYTRIKAVLNSQDTLTAAVAFFSTEVYSQDSYMSEDSVQIKAASSQDYEVEIPASAKLIVISNRKAIAEAVFEVISDSPFLLTLENVTHLMENSDNPIASSVVRKSIASDANYFPKCSLSGDNGKFIYSDTSFVCPPIPVAAGNSVRWIFNSDMTLPCYLRFNDADGNMIGSAPYYSTNGSNGERTITAPSGAASLNASFADNVDYVPSIYINGTLAWSRNLGVYDFIKNNVIPQHFQRDSFIKSVGHRGFPTAAPENTMPSFKEAVRQGFKYIETDVRFTSDNIPVLIHDSTIDRTSNGTGNVSDFTYEELLTYDFGSWFSEDFAGTRIPTLGEFIAFCRATGSHPYIELKVSDSEHIAIIEDVVASYGMRGKVTYISTSSSALSLVSAIDEKSRLGLVVSSITSNGISAITALKTEQNEVFVDSMSYTDNEVALCRNADIPLEVWTITNAFVALKVTNYASGITCEGTFPSYDYFLNEFII